MLREGFWFWDGVVLWQTFFVALALVFATSLNAIFQLTIMLTVLAVGFAVLTLLRPFEADQSQRMQVQPICLERVVLIATCSAAQPMTADERVHCILAYAHSCGCNQSVDSCCSHTQHQRQLQSGVSKPN